MKHSPLPWEAREHCREEHSFIDAVLYGENCTIIDGISWEDAVFIETACNNFERLLTVAKRALTILKAVRDSEYGGMTVLDITSTVDSLQSITGQIEKGD